MIKDSDEELSKTIDKLKTPENRGVDLIVFNPIAETIDDNDKNPLQTFDDLRRVDVATTYRSNYGWRKHKVGGDRMNKFRSGWFVLPVVFRISLRLIL